MIVVDNFYFRVYVMVVWILFSPSLRLSSLARFHVCAVMPSLKLGV